MATLTRTLTHSELLAEIAAGTLHKGESITISDYRTVHTIPSTTDTNTGDLEPLLVTAISNNELKPEAYSLAFPDDVIYYNPVNDQTKVAGCTKGYIYRRIDTKQFNDFPFDFRQVKFRRWQINAPDWVVGTTYAKGNVVQKPSTAELYISLANDNIGNPVTDVIFWRRFEWDNLSYVSWTATSWIIGNISIPCTSLYNDYYFFADGSYTTCFSNQKYMVFDADLISQNNTVVFGANFQNNTIGTNFNYNSIGSNFQYNRIGANFRKNTIGANFQKNTIGANFQNNSIGATFENNSIEANFQGNNIGATFDNNSIEANFESNSIGANFFNNNIGANFNSNSIGDEFYSNSIGAGFYSNSIGTYFQSNQVADNFNNCLGTPTGVDFTSVTQVAEAYTCELFTNASGLPRLRYYDTSDVAVIVVLTQI